MSERAAGGAGKDERVADAWAAHEASQRRARLRTSHRERLLWLEQAKRVAAAALAAARERQEGR